MKMTATACAALILAVAMPTFADDAAPAPKMFQGMQKGRWKVEMIEGPATAKPGRKMPAMSVCTDNLLSHASPESTPHAQTKCKRRLLKDTADEAVMETVCAEHTYNVTLKRESAKVMLIEMKSTGPRGAEDRKMRYTYDGACAEGQAGVTFDKNSPECAKIRERAASMDPAKSCAGAADKREQCEQRMRDMVEKMTAACR